MEQQQLPNWLHNNFLNGSKPRYSLLINGCEDILLLRAACSRDRISQVSGSRFEMEVKLFPAQISNHKAKKFLFSVLFINVGRRWLDRYMSGSSNLDGVKNSS